MWRHVEALAAAERGIADRFARLHAATAALSAALTPAEGASAIASRGASLPGACGCAVALLRKDGAPAGAIVSLLNVALAIGILVMVVKGLAATVISR
ncbi:MAG TPA: hypothetical protein VIW03_08480 [Anaeromyxobacter sp.]